MCASAITACGGGTVNVNAQLHGPCQVQNVFGTAVACKVFVRATAGDPLPGFDQAPTVTVEALRAGRSPSLPKVSAGSGGSMEVRCYDTAFPDAASRHIAWGGTGPLLRLPSSGSTDVAVMLAAPGTAVRTTDGTAASLAQPGGAQCSAMATARAGHTVTRLTDGRLLIVGGAEVGPNGAVIRVVPSAEIYDPLTGQFTVVGTLNAGRVYHTATLMDDGRVLIAGGKANLEGVLSSLVTAEVFDPDSDAFRFLPPPNGIMRARGGRAHHTATLGHDGRVFIAGGVGNFQGAEEYYSTTEYFDPRSETFATGPAMAVGRAFHTATRLAGVQAIIIAGGRDANKVHRDLVILDEDLDEDTGRAVNPVIARPSDFKDTGTDLMDEEHSHHVAGLLVLGSGRERQEFLAIGGGFKNLREVGGTGVAQADFSTKVELFDVVGLRFIHDTELVRRFAGGCAATIGSETNPGLFVGGGQAPGGAGGQQGALMEWRLESVGGNRTVRVEVHETTQNEPRALYGCEALGNGTVLMTGGLATKQGGPTLGSGEVYFP